MGYLGQKSMNHKGFGHEKQCCALAVKNMNVLIESAG